MLLLILFLSIILECFPISSSGNIALFTKWLVEAKYINFSKNILTYIDYLSHGVIAISVALFFSPRWLLFIKKLPRTIPILMRLCIAGFIVEVITVFFWINFYANLDLTPMMPFGFFCTTIFLWSLRFIPSDKEETGSFSFKNAWLFGLAQGIALFPGISRFGTTFVLARWLGFRAQKSFELSFMLGFPINVAAFFLGIYKLFSQQLLYLLNVDCFVVMFLGGSVALLFFWCIQVIIAKNKLWLFSYYTIVLFLIAQYMSR